MIISIGCDHIAIDAKNHLVKYLKDKGHEVIDNGTYDNVRTHYPIYGKKTAEKVVTKEADFGIVVCGTGVGITISANKVKGIRAVLAGDVETARYARQFLNANVLGMGSRVTGIGLMEEIVDVFLQTEYQETKESSELIGKIDELVSNDEQIKDPHFFDEFLEKWKSGAYGGIE